MADNGIHANKKEGNVDGDGSDLLKFRSRWIEKEILIDNNRVNDKTDDGKKFEQQSTTEIKN
jgi:hypothetical protein